jgi:hypothetical protein
VAADTDFGGLLASRRAAEPSVVLFHRQTGRRPREQAALLLANLPAVEADLRDGAIVVIEERRVRVRSLPIDAPGTGRRKWLRSGTAVRECSSDQGKGPNRWRGGGTRSSGD